MTQRSLLAGQTPTVVVHAGGSVTVAGWDSDRVQADTDNHWRLQIERRNAADIGRNRARAKVGEHVLFDVSFGKTKRTLKDLRGEVIEVQLYGSGQVHVPLNSSVKVFAGRDAEVHGIQGRVTATAGRDLGVHNVSMLVHAASGRNMDLDCDSLAGEEFKFGAGRDLRFYIHDLTDAKVMVKDLGGYWEAILGNGRTKISLTAGDVTLVTDQNVVAQPPNYALGAIERPAPAGSAPTTSIETPSQN